MQKDLKGLYFPVLDHGFVALKDNMGSDQAICQSARCSYGPGTKKTSDDRSLIRYLMRAGHHSVFEFAEISLHIGLPIFVMRQLIRTRTANVCEMSGRFSIMPQLFYTPKLDRCNKQSKTNKQGSDVELCMSPAEYEVYLGAKGEIRNELSTHYDSCIKKDLTRELSRIDLPLSMYTFAYWKIDLRNLFNLLKLRLDSHAQWEYQQYARVIAGIVKELYPLCWEAFVDYTLGGVSFSRQERQLLNRLILAPDVKLDGLDEAYFNSMRVKQAKEAFGVAKNDYNMSDREINEFFDKLNLENIFNDDLIKLDYPLARSAEYYENLINQAAT